MWSLLVVRPGPRAGRVHTCWREGDSSLFGVEVETACHPTLSRPQVLTLPPQDPAPYQVSPVWPILASSSVASSGLYLL